jgi:hypothetical protein
MKKINIIILTAFITFLSACYKDKGNYDYNDINEIKITGLAPSYSAVLGVDVLHIEPNIQMTEEITDPDRLSYYWILYRGTTPIDTLATQPVLDARIYVNPDSYNLYLRIVDNETGVAWKAGTTVTVGTRYSSGLMLMGTGENGDAEVDMISMVNDTLVIHGILSNSGLPALRDPMTIMQIGGKDTNSNNGRVWVMTKSGSYYLDRKSMLGNTSKTFATITVTNEFPDKQSLTPILAIPQIKERAGTMSNQNTRAIMTSDGNIFTTHTFLTGGGDYYTNPVNREASNYDKRLKTAPFLWYAIGSMNTMMWYDTGNQRFLNFNGFGIGNTSAVLTDKATDAFPWNQASAGRTLVYGENTRNTDGGSTNGNSFAIMKDNSNQFYIYKFYASGATPPKRDLYTVLPLATNFENATAYAFSSRRTVVFYAVGNTLYAYDYNKGFERSYTFPEIADEITMLKFDTQIDYATNALYIATYNATTKGRLRRYMVGTDPNTVTIAPVARSDWDGLIKVKDMNWRAIN